MKEGCLLMCCCVPSYLAEPHILRQEPDRVNSDSWIGDIGIHDFDDDSVPELIMGDDAYILIEDLDFTAIKCLFTRYKEG